MQLNKEEKELLIELFIIHTKADDLSLEDWYTLKILNDKIKEDY